MLSQQSHCLDLQELGYFFGIGCSSEGRSVDKIEDEGDRHNSESTSSTASQDRIADDAEKSDEEADNGGWEFKIHRYLCIVSVALTDSMISGIDLNSTDVYFDSAPKGPANDEENGDDEQWNNDLDNDPNCTLPTWLIIVSFVERSGDGFEDCQISHKADIEYEPEGGEVIIGGATTDDIDDEEEWLKLCL